MSAEQDRREVETMVEIRSYPGNGTIPLIYLPGMHGDWTLIASFRKALAGRMPFVEMTYPRTLTWSLEDYAVHIETALLRHGITEGWLLAESFGSQVAWPLTNRATFKTHGVILAGGFVRHPAMWAVKLAQRVGGKVPLAIITAILFGYAKVARFRFRNSPEVAAGINEFLARRTELDRQAAIYRLELIFQNDPRKNVRNIELPVYSVSGWIDPVVPWPFVRRWLRRNCKALHEFVLVSGADHNVLGTAPAKSADQVVKWIADASQARSHAKGPS